MQCHFTMVCNVVRNGEIQVSSLKKMQCHLNMVFNVVRNEEKLMVWTFNMSLCYGVISDGLIHLLSIIFFLNIFLLLWLICVAIGLLFSFEV